MRYFVFILFLWFVGMHSVNAAIPIKETNFISPVRYKVRLAGSFGELRGRHFHAGLDIKSSQGRSGDSIFSAESGYISRIRIQRAGYGKSIYVNHANGYTTVYAHLDGYHPELEEYINKKQIEMQSYEVDILPEQGMFEVVKGQHMAFLGNTGISYGPHLHFEIRETSTDKAINPFLFGITAYDKTPPVITSVRITGLRPDFHKVYDYKIPFTGRKKKVMKEISLEVPAWRAGIAIAAHDFMNDSHNKHGIYKLEMWVDDTLYYQVEYGQFLLKETHLIDAHTRFEVARKNYSTEVLCYRMPGNQLTMVQNDKQRGLINLYKDSWRRVELRVSDFNGNESKYRFQIKRAASFEALPSRTPNIRHGQFQQFKHKDLEVGFMPQSLARDIPFEVTSGADSVATEYNIGDSQEPILDGIRLSVLIPEKYLSNKNKLCFARLNGRGRPTDYGQTLKGDSLVTTTTDFGKYGFVVDEKAPDIIPLSFSGSPKGQQFRFRIRDNIQTSNGAQAFTYHVWIDDQWLPCDFRSLSETLTVPIGQLSQGVHDLVIEAKDQFDNLSRWTATFTKK